MAVDTKTMEMLKTEPDISEGLDLSWMDATGARATARGRLGQSDGSDVPAGI